MNKVLRYFAINALVTGTLFAGWALNEPGLSGTIIGVYYGVVVFCYVVFMLCQKTKNAVDALRKISYMSWWKYPLEAGYIALAIYMGYHKIAVAMVFEFIGNIYIQCIKRDIEREHD